MPLTFIITPGYNQTSPADKIKTYLSPLKKLLGLAICILGICATAFPQTRQADSLNSVYDSAINKLFNSIKKLGTEEHQKNIREYDEDVIATRQDEIMDEIKRLTLEAKSYVENGLDTTGFTDELNKIEHWYDVASDGVFKNTGTIQTHRNLETSFKVIRELLTRMSVRKSSLDNYYKNLVEYRNNIDSLYKDSVLYKFSSDSAVLLRYVTKLTVLSQEIKPIDSSLKKTLVDVAELQPIANRLVNKLNLAIERILIFQKDLASKTFNRETSNLGGTVRFTRHFSDIVHFSSTKAALALVFFVRNEIGKIMFLLAIVLIVTMLLVKLKRKLQSQNMIDDNVEDHLVLKYPLLSSLVIVLNIGQFIFIDPPFIFSALTWTTSAIALTIVFRNYVSRFWLMGWIIMFFLFLLACVDNTIVLQASRIERWIMFGLSIAGILSSSTIIMLGKRREMKEKMVIYFIGFVVLMQIASVFANTYGRYNFSKTCLASGFFNVVLAVLFLWTLRFIIQAFSLSAKAYQHTGKKLFNLNFNRSKRRAPLIFLVLTFIAWFILFARNFYAYKLIADPIKNLVVQKRTIGDFSFTIGSILEFFLIIYLSALLSKVVSFFASATPAEHDGGIEKSGIGSWLLIIRISIISIGLLLAFAAVGIPMDKLTIILSALSVGVGFGLQTLVNNLVSGLIISFEKPVNIGDIVEIGGQSGTVKSIGFRSSIISKPDGADVVIPNGDLLNQHLVNWTHNNSYRCVDLPVSVAYGTSLEKAIQILKDLPVKDERVLEIPSPNVIIKQFNTSSIDMQLSFWVKNLREFSAVKTDIILAITAAFKENKIEIPFPQQDLHIRTVTTDGIAKTSVEKKADSN